MNHCLIVEVVLNILYSGAKTLDLEHYMKPSLNKNWWSDAVVIHKGSNDIDFRNLRSETAIKDIAGNIIKIAFLCKEYGIGEVVVHLILHKRNITLSKVNLTIKRYIK